MTTWYVGKTMRLKGTFTDDDGTAVDPGSVVVEVMDPEGNTEETAAERSDTGEYYLDVTFDAPGWWHWRMYSEGTYITAEQGAVHVSRLNVS